MSRRTADSSARRSVSHPFAYHGMPYLLEPGFRAWQAKRPRSRTPSGNRKKAGGISLQDFHPVIQAQYMGVQFTEAGEWSPSWKEEVPSLIPNLHQVPPLPPMHTGYHALPTSHGPVPGPRHVHGYHPQPSLSRHVYVTPPRGGVSGRTPITRGTGELSTPPTTFTWASFEEASPPSTSS